MVVLGRWATIGFAVLSLVLGEVLGGVAMEIVIPASVDRSFRSSDGASFAVYVLVSNSVYVITVVLATSVYVITRELAGRQSGPNVLAYFGLDIPRWRRIAVAMAGLAFFIVFTDTLHLALFGTTVGWRLELIHRSAQKDGLLILLWLATVVAAPIGEELLYRGFMFRGFVHTQRDAIPSIVLISLIWSLLHFRDGSEWLFVAEIFVLGLLFGLVRWRAGSTTLTILLHMLFNLKAWIATEFVLG